MVCFEVACWLFPDSGFLAGRNLRLERSGEIVRISAADPLNLVGILTPGPRVPALRSNRVVYRDGLPVDPEPATDSARAGTTLP